MGKKVRGEGTFEYKEDMSEMQSRAAQGRADDNLREPET